MMSDTPYTASMLAQEAAFELGYDPTLDADKFEAAHRAMNAALVGLKSYPIIMAGFATDNASTASFTTRQDRQNRRDGRRQRRALEYSTTEATLKTYGLSMPSGFSMFIQGVAALLGLAGPAGMIAGVVIEVIAWLIEKALEKRLPQVMQAMESVQ